jgi:FkbM family methyltransferase
MTFTASLKKRLRQVGIVAVRRHHAAVKYLDDPPVRMLGAILLRVFPSLDGLNFIQVGANDGIRGDPIRPMVLAHGWSGVLVEPLPTLFERLRENYRGSPGLEFVNAALDTVVGTRTIHVLRPGLAVPDWAQGLPTFDLARLQAIARGLGLSDGDIQNQEVGTITWDGLRATFGSRACDVLVVDAEGYDITLLRAAGLDRWRPRVIQFENPSERPAERLAFYGELLGLGYEVASDGQDTVAWLPAKASP